MPRSNAAPRRRCVNSAKLRFIRPARHCRWDKSTRVIEETWCLHEIMVTRDNGDRVHAAFTIQDRETWTPALEAGGPGRPAAARLGSEDGSGSLTPGAGHIGKSSFDNPGAARTATPPLR